MEGLERYKTAKVYKIVDNTNGNIYIGSTCKSLCKRLAQHRYDYKKYLSGESHYMSSFEVLKNENYNIVLIENVENCISKEELLKRERFYIDSLDCVNKVIPGRTHKEYYVVNKEGILQKQKEKIDCICGSIVSRSYKLEHEKSKNHIEYCISNNIECNEYKDYIPKHIKNKEKRHTKIICDICNGSYCISNKSSHMKCKKHLLKLELTKDN